MGKLHINELRIYDAFLVFALKLLKCLHFKFQNIIGIST